MGRRVDRREFLKTTLAGGAALALPHLPGDRKELRAAREGDGHPGAGGRAKPNIILCMTDDQGWGDTSYNGHRS